MEVTPRTFGCQSMTGRLERVLVKPPAPGAWPGRRAYGSRGETRPVAPAAGLGQRGGQSTPDAIYAYDPALVTDAGALLLMPGKEGRRREPEEMAVDFMEAGVRLAGQLRFPATAEGGDTAWLAERTRL